MILPQDNRFRDITVQTRESWWRKRRKKRVRDTPGEAIAVQTEAPNETVEASIETNQPPPVAIGGTQTLTPPRTPELKREQEEAENSDEDIEIMFRQNNSKLKLLSQITDTEMRPDDHIAILNEYLNKSHTEIKPLSRPTTTSSVTFEDADGAINFDPNAPTRKRKPRRPSSAVVEQSLPNSSKFLQVLHASDED